jgi:uncharacterized protein (DUF924 family)
LSQPREVLDFWFGATHEPRKAWFQKNEAMDAEIARRFGIEVEQALDGALGDWAHSGDGRLALVLLLDQFTRNIFRATPRAFAGDARALCLVQQMVTAGEELALPPLRRAFVYLPFMHAEDVALQERSVVLHADLAADAQPLGEPFASTATSSLDFAKRHHDVILRFGRFPHRNEILARTSTAQELAFLAQPGSRF